MSVIGSKNRIILYQLRNIIDAYDSSMLVYGFMDIIS